MFLPGAGGRRSFWLPVADLLVAQGERHLLAWPGFGDVPADDGVRSLSDLFDWVVARLPAGASHVVAQSMGGVVAARLAIERPERVGSLVLAATSGGVDVARLGAADWRDAYRRELPGLPPWFTDDRTDLTARLGEITSPTLLLWSDSDPVSPLAVGTFLAARIRTSRLATIAGGSHAFANERAREVAAEIDAHLGG